MSSEAGTAQAAAPAGSYQWRWLAFAVVLVGSVMDLLDSLATNVAGPAIRADAVIAPPNKSRAIATESRGR